METPQAIRILRSQELADFLELIALFEDVFEMKDFSRPDQNYLRRLLEKPDFWVLVAKQQAKIVGGLTVYVLEQYYAKKPLAYIYDLAVLREFQRKGIGRKLMEHLLNHCKARGFDTVFVQADRVDDYALDFYRSTNPSQEEDVIHFDYTFPA